MKSELPNKNSEKLAPGCVVVSFGNICSQSASLPAYGDAVWGMRPQQHCGAKLIQFALSASGPPHLESKVSLDIAVCSLLGSQRHRHVTYHVCLAFIADDAARSPGLRP